MSRPTLAGDSAVSRGSKNIVSERFPKLASEFAQVSDALALFARHRDGHDGASRLRHPSSNRTDLIRSNSFRIDRCAKADPCRLLKR